MVQVQAQAPTSTLLLLSLTLSSTLSTAEPARVLNRNFADPAIIQTPDGWYAFATTSGDINVQVAHSSDFDSWGYLDDHDALPGPFPAWVASDPQPWAPDVFQRDDGQYVMYYSAIPRADSRRHCLGVAISSAIEGPYTAVDGDGDGDEAWACPLSQGGAIDASGFRDDDGTLYIAYKVDGSALNTDDENYHPTPLVLQEVADNGYSKVGDAVTLIDRDESDGPLVEAPSIVKADGFYYLLYSSHMFNSPDYDSKYATAPSVAGPWTRRGRVVAPGDSSDVGPLSGPGGADVSADGTKFVFHANINNQDPSGGRAMYATRVSLEGGNVTFVNES
ncbi:glycoside hydrolase family 43 protein [Aspergillus mulundensis]|uniref:Uncharacterized protein n=1 Tax=Aspergillus mulundensis TaxID=1810919 RepID=A0A3D8S5L0_9EURO|nr:hypothetical protein DSM5745_05154 [Aspergillus mulundensis]RDW81597.1 hypothetical protein DSM5745_05154 [Aspergillus mulundensis]